jgi:D-amino-acid dehydrogenase
MLLRRQPALQIRAGAFPPLFPWGLQFLRNCRAEKYQQNTRAVLRLAMLSREELAGFTAHETTDFDLRKTGKLHLYQVRSQLQAASALVTMKNQLGFRQEIWGREECLQREPALRAYQGPLAGGVFSPLDESGDTFKLIERLTASCARSGHFDLLSNTEVTGFKAAKGMIRWVKTSHDKLAADAYVICAGAQSPRIAKTLGLKLPIVPVKGYSVTVPAWDAAPKINLTDTTHKIVFTRLGERLRIAGMMEFAGSDRRISKDRIEYLRRLASTILPQAGDYAQLLASWSGLRPMTPDGVPIIGPTDWKNLWLNVGHGMLGSTLAFGSARLVAELIDDMASNIDPADYSLWRYA